MPNSKTVKIFQAKDDISDIVKEAVAGSGLRGKRKIFIKPNLSHPEYLPGVVTSPEFMQQLVSLFRDGNSEVIVGESNGFNYPCWTAFEKTGVQAAVKQAGGTVINLSEDKVVKVKFPDGNTAQRAVFAQNHLRR